jgi:serine/threonine protein phosphatase PrpC
LLQLKSYAQELVKVTVPVVFYRRDAFLVLACDGIWDVMSNQDVVDFMATKLGYTGNYCILTRVMRLLRSYYTSHVAFDLP